MSFSCAWEIAAVSNVKNWNQWQLVSGLNRSVVKCLQSTSELQLQLMNICSVSASLKYMGRNFSDIYNFS